MEWFLALFILTGIWTWVVAGIFFFIILAFAENDKNWLAGFSLLIFSAMMYHSGFLVLTDPWLIGKYFAYYFALGAAWSTIKWWRYLTGKADEFKTLKERYITNLNYLNRNEQSDAPVLLASYKTELPEELLSNFKNFLIDKLHIQYLERATNRDSKTVSEIVIPTAQDNKERITTWILWWPTSLFWTILNDPLVKLANAIYDRFQGIYSHISNMVFKDIGL